MSSTWPTVLSSLDDSLAAVEQSLQQIEAARLVDLDSLMARLMEATESSQKLRTSILEEVPQAAWQDRAELDVLLEERAALTRRAYLLALANELEYGSIAHRRAARVAQLNQLREHAVDELRALAAHDNPIALPGPQPMRWMEWASGLKEPEDTAALQALRAGFPRLDEFVAALEPGMWQVPVSPEPEQQAQAASIAVVTASDLEQRRSRLLALASELERGMVVHHRAIRVTQVNQLREQAIEELRFQAVVARIPALLPGPEPEKWVPWACSLAEPQDAEALQHLRSSFEHLDEFVANIEHDMWICGSAAQAAAVPPEPAREQTRPEPVWQQPAERDTARAAVLEEALPIAIVAESEPAPSMFARVSSKLAGFSHGKARFVLPSAVLLLALLGAMQWRLHRTHASTPAKPAEVAAPDPAPPSVEVKTDVPATPTSSGAKTPEANDKSAKSKDTNAAANAAAPPPSKPVSLLNTDSLLTPQPMPKPTTVARTDDSGAGDAPVQFPGTVPGGVPNTLNNLVKEVPVAPPKLPPQKIRVSSGVAQGQLIHEVTPQYPLQAKLAGVQGVVVLQAVIGKDGRVQNVKALRGPSMLVPAALDAVKQWRYKPFSVNGEPTEADIEVNVKFTP